MSEHGLPLNRRNVKAGNDETTYYWLTEEQAHRWKLSREGDAGGGQRRR